ncbi:MAG TPA: DUF1501 domain-containing protein [Pirellulales bacterium]|nr:DUF1501 domain-containing protein [Pirellulales bacterium]
MLSIGSFNARVCQGVTRRSFLQYGASLPLGAGLAAWSQKAGAEEYGAVRAKSVLLVWLWGAPSHLDTFDPKPKAPAAYRGPFSPIATRMPGVQFTELMPRLAARSDRFSLIRSNQTKAPGHPDAGTLALTGAPEAPGPVWPNFGSIVARHRGDGRLPPFISLGRGIPRDVVRPIVGYGGGQWGKAYDPFMVSCSEQGQVDIPTLKLIEGLSPDRLSDRRALLAELDRAERRLDQTPLADWNRKYESAYALLTSAEARQALDLSRESPATREAYGQTSFGQSCLLARRLVEAEVPYVQVNWSQYVEAMTPNCDFGWDTHIYNFELLADRHGPIFDRVFSALLDDLEQRGLLRSTLVVAMGEFGRTPKINAQAARDHWPQCYFSIWAGGGVQPGRVIGESDKLAQEPITDPISPAMVGTTICELAGINTQTRAEMKVLDGGQVIHELL